MFRWAVLVVDDDATEGEAIRRALHEAGATSVAWLHPSHASDQVVEVGFDLVVVDVDHTPAPLTDELCRSRLVPVIGIATEPSRWPRVRTFCRDELDSAIALMNPLNRGQRNAYNA